MLIETKFLGEVEIDEQQIVTFELGLPGFPAYTKYVLLSLDSEMPLAVLQCVEDAAIGFIVAFPFAFKEDYGFDLSDEDIKELQIENEDDITTYAILTLQETLAQSTMNLLAPIVINVKTKLAKQIVLADNGKYSLRYPLATTQGSVN